MSAGQVRKSWLMLRVLLFFSAFSLALFIPYKYATQLHAVEGIYAFLFPLSSVLAVGGMIFAIKPQWSHKVPRWLAAGLAALGSVWIATGILCIPSLMKTTLSAPLLGLFATFHMTAQHIFLSGALIFLLLAPRYVYGLFNAPLPEGAEGGRKAVPLSEVS